MLQLKIFNTDRINTEEVFRKYYGQMPPQRKNKVDKCRIDMDKKRSLGVGILINEFMREHNLSTEQSAYKVGKNGKPYFDGFCFNASHSGKYAVCVFADNEVGCDIEQLNGKDLRIAQRFYSENEQKYVFDRDFQKLSNERFVRIWTLRESYLKYLGTGLTKPLSSFGLENLSVCDNNKLEFPAEKCVMTIDCESTKKSRAVIVDNDAPADCYFYEYRIADAYISICTGNVK